MNVMTTRTMATSSHGTAGIAFCVLFLLLQGCSGDLHSPVLPDPESVEIADGVALDPEQLFGTWEGSTAVGSDNTNYFEQSYRIDFQSVDDAEALFSHWFVDASSSARDSVCNLPYAYRFDGSALELEPLPSARNKGAVAIKAVHTGGNNMVLYTVKEQVTTSLCTLTRTGDPEPAVTGVNRTMPLPGQTVSFTGRNLQFVDHVFLPTADGELEVTDFTSSSKLISFTVPTADYVPGHVRFYASGAHVSSYSPAMFCRNCVFFHNFSAEGTAAPYTGTEFENTINISQTLIDKLSVVSSEALPAGHCLTLGTEAVISPDSMLCYFGDAPAPWAVDSGLDPDTGYLRFSFGDRIRYVIDHSDGMLSDRTKCKDAAVEMDIYVYSDGEPLWNTGFLSFRLDKDQGKSLTQSWFAQTAMWELDEPVSFADGWQTYTIPLSAFTITENESYSTLGKLSSFLTGGGKQTLVKLLNYQLDATHPAQALSSFQFCLADMRLVPYGVPANTRDEPSSGETNP